MAEPVRTCVGCGRAASKRALVRLVRGAGGAPIVDARGRRTGRGAYVCARRECVERALRGGLARSWRAAVVGSPAELWRDVDASLTRDRKARTGSGDDHAGT